MLSPVVGPCLYSAIFSWQVTCISTAGECSPAVLMQVTCQGKMVFIWHFLFSHLATSNWPKMLELLVACYSPPVVILHKTIPDLHTLEHVIVHLGLRINVILPFLEICLVTVTATMAWGGYSCSISLGLPGRYSTVVLQSSRLYQIWGTSRKHYDLSYNCWACWCSQTAITSVLLTSTPLQLGYHNRLCRLCKETNTIHSFPVRVHYGTGTTGLFFHPV